MKEEDLGVYISCFNEEFTIVHSWKAASKVFPQVQVIDVGSTDSSVARLKKAGAKVIREPVMIDDVCAIRYANEQPLNLNAYNEVKNHYVGKHEWVLYIDGDEVWPEDQLRKIIPTINTDKWIAYRIGWKFATEDPKILYDNHVTIADPKVFRGDLIRWIRPQPKDYQVSRVDRSLGIRLQFQPETESPFFWCWHLKFMKRSSVIDARRERRLLDTQHYQLDKFTKIPVGKFPWEDK